MDHEVARGRYPRSHFRRTGGAAARRAIFRKVARWSDSGGWRCPSAECARVVRQASQAPLWRGEALARFPLTEVVQSLWSNPSSSSSWSISRPQRRSAWRSRRRCCSGPTRWSSSGARPTRPPQSHRADPLGDLSGARPVLQPSSPEGSDRPRARSSPELARWSSCAVRPERARSTGRCSPRFAVRSPSRMVVVHHRRVAHSGPWLNSAAGCWWQPSDSPRAPCPRTTASSTPSACTSTHGRGLDGWPWGWPARATICSSRGMTRGASARPSTVNVLCGLFVWLSPLVVPQLEAEDVESNPRCAPARPNQTLHH